MMRGFSSKLLLFLGLVVLTGGSRIVRFSYEDIADNAESPAEEAAKYDPNLPRPVLEVLQWLYLQSTPSQIKVKDFSWNNCGKPSKVILMKSISVTPDPIKKDSPAQISAVGNLTDNINSPFPVDVLAEIRYMGIWHTIPCRGGAGSCSYPDFCTKLPAGSCPMKKGSFSFQKSMVLPAALPAATYRITANMNSPQGFLACVQILFDVAD